MATKKVTKRKVAPKKAKKKIIKKVVKKAAPKKAIKKKVVKKVVKKVAAKKTVKKAVKKTVKKVVKKTAPKKMALVKGKPLTKSQAIATVALHTGLSKKDVTAVGDAWEMLIAVHLKKGAVGRCKVFGLINVKAVKKPARKARKGINPFTGQEIMIKAKPASRGVRATALKRLKEMA